MRRVGSTFVTLWLIFLLPSLIVWGFMVRWSESSAARFESVWRWCADRLAFPLVLSPATDWSWVALHDGGYATATSGFLILASVWALMLALPLAIIGGWWVWITNRLTKGSPQASTSSSLTYMAPYEAPLSLPATTGHQSLSRPSGAIYLITLPLALAWNGLRALFSPRRIDHPFVNWWRPVIRTSFLAFVLTLAIFWIYLLNIDVYTRWNMFRLLTFDVWEGYLDLMYVPSPFEHSFYESLYGFVDRNDGASGSEWSQVTRKWFDDPELRTVGLVLALRHAIGAAMIAIALRLLGSVFR